jgi:hypothetical protein
VEPVDPAEEEGASSVQDGLPHVAFFDRAVDDGGDAVEPLRTYRPSANGSTPANGNGRFGPDYAANGHAGHGPAYRIEDQEDDDLAEPAAIGSDTALDEAGQSRPRLAVAHRDRT